MAISVTKAQAEKADKLRERLQFGQSEDPADGRRHFDVRLTGADIKMVCYALEVYSWCYDPHKRKVGIS